MSEGVSLSKYVGNAPISLKKGESISLKKSQDDPGLTKIRVAAGWDAVKQKGRGLFGRSKEIDIDLDLSAILFDVHGNEVDAVWFQQKKSNDRALKHSGDNLTGDGDGDDEVINVDLTQVSTRVSDIVFVVTSYSGQKFADIERAFCRVVDASRGEKEAARLELTEQGNHTANVMAKLTRQGSGWKFTAIGENANGRTYHDVVRVARSSL